MIKIPFISPQQSSQLWENAEAGRHLWAEAARIEKFNDVGGSAGIPVATVVELLHDGETLWVHGILQEPVPIFAGERNWRESFTGDSALRVALGAGASGTQGSAIAGYDSAYSSRQNLRHFYEYTVNAAGSLSRMYNEGPLRNALCSGKVVQSNTGWEAWLAIPLKSAGIVWKPGEAYYCNFFRFYRGARYGWVLAGYGGYTPLQFGMMELLPQERNKEKSIVPPLPLPTSPAVPAAAPEVSAPTLTYYPLAGKVTGQMPPGDDGRVIEMRVGDQREKLVLSSRNPVTISLPVTHVAGNTFSAGLFDGSHALESREYTVPEMPEWLHTQAGMEYVSGKVAFPWSPLVFADGVLRLAHADWQFDDTTLVRQIAVKDQLLLRAPMYVTATLADGTVVPVASTVDGRELQAAFMESSPIEAPGKIEVKTRVEFDGFSIFRLRAREMGETGWQQLSVHIPLQSGVAKFLNFGSSQELLQIGHGGYQGDPGEFWVGNGNIGLAFSYDRDCFPNGTRAARVEINVEEIVIRLADEGSGSFPADFVWQFFLQPTPVRGDIIPPMSNQMALGPFERWSDYQGYPDLKKIPDMKQVSDLLHRKNEKFYIYFSNLLAENSPGYLEYRTDLEALPQRMWYRRDYDPGRGINCYVTCLRSERADQMLDGVEKLLQESKIDGVYLDGPTVAFECENSGHSCSDRIAAVWDGAYHEGRILGQRRFLQRLRGIFDSRGFQYPLWAHTGGGLNTATLGLADFYFDGEQLHRFRDGYLVEPEKFRINYACSALGVRGIFLPILYINSTFTTRQSLPWALVHGTETVALVKDYHSLERFFFRYLRQENPAVFYPYWESQPHWELHADETVFGSYLKLDDEGVIVVSNLYQDGEKEVEIALEKFFDGVPFRVECLNAGKESFRQNGDRISFLVGPGKMKMFYLTTNDTLPEDIPVPERPVGNSRTGDAIPENKGFTAGDWVVPEGKLGMDGNIAISDDHAGEATVAYRHRLPAEFTLHIRLEHSGAIEIGLDELKTVYKPDTGWLIYGVDEFANEDYSATSHNGHRGGHVALDRPVELVVSMRDGHVNIAYDGVRLLQNALPAIDNASHSLYLSVPAGSGMSLELQDLKASGEVPFHPSELQHPILR